MRKRFLILSIIGLMLVGLLGTTYAYYTIHIDDTKESISTSTANLGSLTAEGESLSLISPNPSDSMSETTYKVISSSDTTEDRSYTLSLQIDQNTFVNTVEDLQGNSTTQNGQLVIEVTLPSNVETFTFYEDAPDFITFNSSTNVITIDVTDSTTAVADTYQLLKGVIIEAADTQEYDVTFQFKNLSDYNQSDNMGKKFRGGLIIEADKNPDIIPGYTKVAYLESSGHQYIDTGIIPRNIYVYADMQGTSNEPNNAFFGIFKTNAYYYITYWSESWSVGAGSNRDYNGKIYNPLERHIFETRDENNNFKIDGNIVLTNSNIPLIYDDGNYNFNSIDTMFIFARRTASTPTYGEVKIFELKIFDRYNHYSLIQHLTPCLSKSDSKPGMCDTVSNIFFANQGTGEFGYETLDGTYVAPQ